MLYDKRWEAKAPVKLEPWQQCLLQAAELLRELGWCQGQGVNQQGEMCALGAIGSTIFNDFTRTVAIRRLITSLSEQPRGYPCVSIPAWNDAPSRTKEQVIAALENAAKG